MERSLSKRQTGRLALPGGSRGFWRRWAGRAVAFTCALIAGPAATWGQLAAPEPERIGVYQRTLGGLQSPTGIALAADGMIFISEGDGDRVIVEKPDGGRLVIGRSGSGANELLGPADVALLGERLHVVDRGNHRIQVVTPDGRFLTSFGGHGSGAGRFVRPGGIDAAGERIIVADSGNHRVQVFDREGAWLLSVGGYGRGPGQFIEPRDVAIGPDGSIFVADTLNCRVQRFQPTGELLQCWGEPGFAPGMLAEPEGVLVAGETLLVADTRNHRIQHFSLEGAYRGAWGTPALRPREGEGLLHYPTRIVMPPGGDRQALVESFENRAQLFRYLPPSTTQRRTPAALDMSSVPHFDQRGAIHERLLAVIEPDTHSVLIFDMRRELPVLIHKLGAYGDSYGKFIRPSDVAFDGRGRLWVVDSGNQRLQSFELRYDAPAEIKYEPFLSRFVRAFDLRSARASLPIEPGAELGVVALECARDGGFWLLDTNHNLILSLSPDFEVRKAFGGAAGEGPRLVGPVEIAWDGAEKGLMVVDALAARVVTIDPETGKTRGVIELAPGANELPARPFAAMRAGNGELMVSDTARGVIRRYDATGAALPDWGREGLGRGEFFKPGGLLRDDRERIIVIDSGNHRMQFFSPQRDFIDAMGARLYVQPTRIP